MGATKRRDFQEYSFSVHYSDPKMNGSEVHSLCMRKPDGASQYMYLSHRELDYLKKFLNEVLG